MKSIILVLLVLSISSEYYAQPIKQKEGFADISIGFGIAKAFRYKYDSLERNYDTRFLINTSMTLKVYRHLYFTAGFEYNKKDVDGYFNTYNISLLPSYGGRAFNNKVSYFAEAGPNVHIIFWGNDSGMIVFGLTLGLKAQYNINERFSAGIDLRHINYFNIWSEHYFIVHSDVYFAIKIWFIFN